MLLHDDTLPYFLFHTQTQTHQRERLHRTHTHRNDIGRSVGWIITLRVSGTACPKSRKVFRWEIPTEAAAVVAPKRAKLEKRKGDVKTLHHIHRLFLTSVRLCPVLFDPSVRLSVCLWVGMCVWVCVFWTIFYFLSLLCFFFFTVSSRQRVGRPLLPCSPFSAGRIEWQVGPIKLRSIPSSLRFLFSSSLFSHSPLSSTVSSLLFEPLDQPPHKKKGRKRNVRKRR